MFAGFAGEQALLDSIMAGAAGYVLKQIRGSDQAWPSAPRQLPPAPSTAASPDRPGRDNHPRDPWPARGPVMRMAAAGSMTASLDRAPANRTGLGPC